METITGRVVANATVRTTKKDKKVTGFTVALNDSYKPKDGDWVQITRYVECAYWRNPGIAEYLTKGTLVELYGRMEAGAYTNKEGKAVGTLTMNVERVKRLGRTGNNGTERMDDKAITQQTVYAESKGTEDDDLPF